MEINRNESTPPGIDASRADCPLKYPLMNKLDWIKDLAFACVRGVTLFPEENVKIPSIFP